MSDQDTNAPWRNEELLREKYWDENLSLSQVATELDCSTQTVSNWMDRHDISKRKAPGEGDTPYRDEALLKELYWGEGLSTLEISTRLDCSKYSVQKWMKEYGIETRESNHEKTPAFHTNKEGYESIHIGIDYETYQFPIHRLIAVAEGELPPDKLKGRELNVHHKNEIPWDNRWENLEVLSHEDHARHHSEGRNRDVGRFS